MSMNLHSPQLDLWHPPTWVTFLALSDADGNKRTLKEAKHVYSEWVKSTWHGAEEINAHLAKLHNVTEMDIKLTSPHCPTLFRVDSTFPI